MSYPARLCHNRQEPGAHGECLEACWSQGRSCKTCWVTCYRQGWTKRQVDKDNAQLVAQHLKAHAAQQQEDAP